MVTQELENNTTYTLFYDANGGENAPDKISNTGNSKYSIFHISDQAPTREGFFFKGWSTTKDEKNLLQSGDFFSTNTTSTTLFAIWGEENTVEQTEPLGVSVQSFKDSMSFTEFYSIAFFAAAIVGIVACGFLLIREHKTPKILSSYQDDDF